MPDFPVRIYVGDGPGGAETRKSCLRVWHFFVRHRGEWVEERAAGIALSSSKVHARIDNLCEKHGELFEREWGRSTAGGKRCKLFRLRDDARAEPLNGPAGEEKDAKGTLC